MNRPSYLLGAARAEITPKNPVGVPLTGWGDPFHVAKSVATPLYARAVAIVEPAGAKRAFLVCLDLWSCTQALQMEIAARLARLGIREDEVVVSGTHTHSAPGGISQSALYESVSGGFIPEVFDTIVEGAVRAVARALETARPGRLRFAAEKFPVSEPVAFNRSLRAYNRNPEVTRRSPRKSHLAVDREMCLLRLEDEKGDPIASYSWFAVHATSIHRDRYRIHSDNKGLAATGTEDALRAKGHPDFVAIFANSAAGDVSPNFRWHRRLRELRGIARNDERSCEMNASLQRDRALSLLDLAAGQPELAARVSSFLEFRDFSFIEVHPDFVGGRTGIRTGPAEIGTPQLYGTSEGKGAPFALVFLCEVAIRVAQLYNFFVDSFARRPTRWPFSKHPVQWNKITVVESGRAMMFETGRVERIVFPGWVNPIVARMKLWARRGILRERPFTPQVLPLQVIELGPLAIVAVPAEFTTVSGWRLRAVVEAQLRSRGVRRAIIQGYAGAYTGYVTTPEEYPVQAYEGGCTHFGRWTLPAYLTVFREICAKIVANEAPDPLRPTKPSEAYVRGITRET